MRARFRPSMYVLAAALLGLIALLATLQYRWLGQVSAAERERMKTNLAGRTTAFAQEFDREITRAYLTFQTDLLQHDDNLAARVAGSYERWQATSRYPRMVKSVYIIPREPEASEIRRYDPATRFIEPVEWPSSFTPLRDALAAAAPPAPSDATIVVRTTLPVVWEEIPALVVPTPIVMFERLRAIEGGLAPDDVKFGPSMSYSVLELDRDYIAEEMLPVLRQQHFRGAAEGVDYELAVVGTDGAPLVYSTNPQFVPEPGAAGDADAQMFQVRVQDHGAMAAEVRRSLSFFTRALPGSPPGAARSDAGTRGAGVRGMLVQGESRGTITMRETPPVSIVLQHNVASAEARKGLEATLAAVAAKPAAAAWRVVVTHPSGSLETAVANVRRRNLIVSSGILGILGLSVAFLVVSTRRAQDLARQQMEFVAAVSHELRTPLAVIRSAADNLADGVVQGDGPVRKYGELVRGEGRRLSEMVEQILELAGIQSGQRSFVLRPVAVLPLLNDVVRASEPLLQEADLHVEYAVADRLPPVLGDEQALRRVFQNLLGNAIKYGANGRWIGVTARPSGGEVLVTVADRGIGIQAAEQENIFKPFYRTPGVIEAQIQGAGLGLSLVQRIVEAHGGRITLRSAPGEGSAFTVHLPSASEEPAHRTSSAQHPAPSGAEG